MVNHVTNKIFLCITTGKKQKKSPSGQEEKRMKERKMNTAALVIAIIGVVGVIMTAIICNYRINQLQNNTITRVVSIYNDGEGGEQTLSLTSQGWLDFFRTYEGAGSTISNVDFEDLFTFTEVDSWYPEEVKNFLDAEKENFAVWTPLDGYDDSLYGGDFVLYYDEYRDGIRLLFDNPEDDIQVEYELSGAKHAKRVYTFIGGGDNDYNSLYYLVFEDKEGRVMAINQDMKMYQLSTEGANS